MASENKELILQTDHNGKDITSRKVYLDTATGEFKKRIRCPVCNVVIQCMCFSDIDAAIDCGSNAYCSRHYVEEVWYDQELYYTIDKLFNTELNKYLTLIHAVSDGDFIINDENTKYVSEGLWCKCNKIVSDLTDKQIDELISGAHPDYDEFDGTICEV